MAETDDSSTFDRQVPLLLLLSIFRIWVLLWFLHSPLWPCPMRIRRRSSSTSRTSRTLTLCRRLCTATNGLWSRGMTNRCSWIWAYTTARCSLRRTTCVDCLAGVCCVWLRCCINWRGRWCRVLGSAGSCVSYSRSRIWLLGWTLRTFLLGWGTHAKCWS